MCLKPTLQSVFYPTMQQNVTSNNNYILQPPLKNIVFPSVHTFVEITLILHKIYMELWIKHEKRRTTRGPIDIPIYRVPIL